MTTDVQLRTQTPLHSLLIPASTHTHSSTACAFSCKPEGWKMGGGGGVREQHTKYADLMVEVVVVVVCSQIL